MKLLGYLAAGFAGAASGIASMGWMLYERSVAAVDYLGFVSWYFDAALPSFGIKPFAIAFAVSAVLIWGTHSSLNRSRDSADVPKV